MRRLLGPEAELLEASLQKSPVTGLRVNTLKSSASEFARLSPWSLEPVPWCPAGFTLESEGRPGLHPFHAAGLFYLQEPSAMAVAEALAPRPGELVLDLAAAPGGKSTHLAALLGESGLLVANDTHGGRARELSRNLERWGARCALVTSAAPEVLAALWPALFDAVLVDAPCSGEGMFRKGPEALAHWSQQVVAACATRQDGLLADAARLVKPGGRLVYSTCTLGAAENEEVIGRFLAGRPDWQAVEIVLPGVSSGNPEWSVGERADELRHAARLWPHRQKGEGHFLALLRRGHEPAPVAVGSRTDRMGYPLRRRGEGRRRTAAPAGASAESAQASELWRRFQSHNLVVNPFPEHELVVQRDGLYAVPPGAPDLDGVRVLRPGLWLGQVEHERFAPSHSLALALRPAEVRLTVSLRPGASELDAYLAGAELELPGDDGWALVTVAGHPLGWGRRGRDIVKNHYPKGLRRQGR